MINGKNTEEVLGGCSHVSYTEFMRSELAELTIEHLFRSICDDLLKQLPKDAAAALAGALRDYVECANARIRVRQRTKEFETSCLRVAENCNLDVRDSAQLERYVLPFMMSSDFRMLEKWIKKLRQEAGKIGLEWKDLGPIITRVADRLVQSSASHEATPDQNPVPVTGAGASPTILRSRIRGDRRADIALRRVVLRNYMASRQPFAAKRVCEKWDADKVPVPEPWHVRGVLSWKEAYEDPSCDVHKLVSKEKSTILKQSAHP
jgi:hypothetical protein